MFIETMTPMPDLDGDLKSKNDAGWLDLRLREFMDEINSALESRLGNVCIRWSQTSGVAQTWQLAVTAKVAAIEHRCIFEVAKIAVATDGELILWRDSTVASFVHAMRDVVTVGCVLREDDAGCLI